MQIGLIFQRVGELIGSGACTVWFWDETAQVLVPQVWHSSDAWRGEVRLRLGEGVAGAVARRREGLLVNDYRTSPYTAPAFLERTKVTAVMGEPLLEDILVIARGLANKKSQVITAHIPDGLPQLTADPVRFKQILFNLLSNAVKFTPERGTITVRARRNPQSATGDFLEIAVSDTGVGIRPEDMPKLFGEFVQLETTWGRRHEGTGLGLALTKRLVEMHGGRIWAESEGEGKGSTFTLRLPCEGAVERGA